MATMLAALLLRYAPRRLAGRSITPEAHALAATYDREQPGPKEWLRELSGLVTAAGYSSVYCLLDGLDELQETRDNPAQLFALLCPLLDAPGLLQGCGFAFRFFLPQDLEAAMEAQRIGRLDRIPRRSLRWSEDQLVLMLARRLVSFARVRASSHFTRAGRFQALCNLPYDVDRHLVQAAGHSPRRLIDLARMVIEAHCRQASSSDDLIEQPVIDAVTAPIAGHGAEAASSQTLPVSSFETGQAAQHAPADEQVVAPLFIDSRGMIWIGEDRRTVELGGLMRRCLEYLWSHRERRVDYDELLVALYGKDWVRRGDPQGSMEKLVQRLREVLEGKGRSASHTYIKTVAGVGYLLQNYSDTQMGC